MSLRWSVDEYRHALELRGQDVPEWARASVDSCERLSDPVNVVGHLHDEKAPWDDLRKVLEVETFQPWVVKVFRDEGWEAYHTHDSRRSERGFPDLVLVRQVVLYRELKTMTGRLSLDQRRWRDALQGANEDWDLWRPSDWPAILQRARSRV